MKSVLRHPLSIVAILTIIGTAVTIPATSRAVAPIQLGDNRSAERDRLAEQYGISKEAAGQLMVRLEREKGIKIINSLDLPDGASLDFYHINGNTTSGRMTEFQGTGRYYRADSAVGQAYRDALATLKRTSAGDWANKQLDLAKQFGFYVIPASLIPQGGGAVARGIGQAAGGASTAQVRVAVVGTEFPHWHDHNPYSNSTGGYDVSTSYGVLSNTPGSISREWGNIQYEAGANTQGFPIQYYADGPGGHFNADATYGLPRGLTAFTWDSGTEIYNYPPGGTNPLTLPHPGAGGVWFQDQNQFINDWVNRLFGTVGLSNYYFENSHGHIRLVGDQSSVIGWLQSHHYLDRVALRGSVGGAVQGPSSHFYQPTTPLLRPYPPTAGHVVGATLNVLGFTVLFDRDVNATPALNNLRVMVADSDSKTASIPGILVLTSNTGGALPGSWVADPYDHRRWTLQNPGGNSWYYAKANQTPPLTYTQWAINQGHQWAATIVATAADTTGINFPINASDPSVDSGTQNITVGTHSVQIRGQGGGFQLWTSNQSAGVYGTTLTQNDLVPTSPQWPADVQKFCRLKSYCYYVHNHGFTAGASEYQDAHVYNASGNVDDIAGTVEQAAGMADRPFPFNHSLNDDAGGTNGGNVLAAPPGQGDHTSGNLEGDVGRVLADEGVNTSYDRLILLYPNTFSGGAGGEGGGSDIIPHAGGGGIVVPEQAGLGLLAHEMGHTFGTSDLYDLDLYANSAIPPPNPKYLQSLMMGDFSVMAMGAGVRMDAWTKLYSVGTNGILPGNGNGPWAQEFPITTDSPGISIPAAQGTLKDPQIIKLPASPYYIRNGVPAANWQEFFLLENRVQDTVFGDPSPAGLYIYHIDRRGSQASELFPKVILVESAGKKYLTRADLGHPMGPDLRNGVVFPGLYTDSQNNSFSTRKFTWYSESVNTANSQTAASYQAVDPLPPNQLQTYAAPKSYSNGVPAGGDPSHPYVTTFTPTDSFTRVLNISNPGPNMAADVYVEPAEVVVEKVLSTDSDGTYAPSPATLAAGVQQGARDFHMLTLRLTNTGELPELSTKDVVLDTLNIFQSGSSTADTDLDSASLWAETNGAPGLQTSGTPDTRLGTVNMSNLHVTFTGLGYRIFNRANHSSPQYLYLTYNVSRTAQISPKVYLGSKIINQTDFMPQPPGVPQLMKRYPAQYDLRGEYRFPISGDLVNIIPAPNVLTVQSTSVAPATAKQGAVDVPMLKSRCSVNATDTPPQGSVQVSEIKLWQTGSVAQTGLTTARVYLDANDNGVVDAGDTKLSEATFVPDATYPNGTALIADFTSFPIPLKINAGAPVSLLFTVSVASSDAASLGKTIAYQLRNDANITPVPATTLFSFFLQDPTNNTVSTANFSSATPPPPYGQNSNATTIVVANHAPTLTSVVAPAQQLNPLTGKQSDTYTYQVIYTDQDNDAPAPIQVYIDDAPFTMTPVGTPPFDYTKGVVYQYQAAGTLTPGVHHYYFQASDGQATVQLKDTGNNQFVGPTVNNPPTLTNGSVTPDPGLQTATFTFTVTYRDLDGDVPGTINVYVQNTTTGTALQSYALTPVGGTPTSAQVQAGWPYSVQISPSLPSVPIVPIGDGDHTFYFVATDAAGETSRFPAAGTIAGPLVNDPPGTVLAGFTPADGTSTNNATPTISWTAASDPNRTDLLPTNKLYYKVEISSDPAFGAIQWSGTTTAGPNATTITVGTPLAVNTPTNPWWYYRITTYDGHNAPSAQPSVPVKFAIVPNRAPTLTAVVAPAKQLDPLTGRQVDTFTYQVVYTDLDNDAPNPIQVYIDDAPFTMTPVGNPPYDYTKGIVFQYQVVATLAPGVHHYYFQASDGQATVQLKDVGNAQFTGPTVNTPPVLSNGAVNPGTGSQNAAFTFSANYRDAEGQLPANISVFVQNTTTGAPVQSFVLTPVGGGTPTAAQIMAPAGVAYQAIVQPNPPSQPIVPIGDGDHVFYFTASDGVDTTRLPAGAATLPGPLVNDPPLAPVSGFSPANNAAITNTTPLIRWDQATDPNLTDAGKLFYRVELTNKSVSGVPDFTAPVFMTQTTAPGANSNQWQLTTALAAGDYWYRIISIDAHNAESPASTPVKFTIVANRAPNPPPSGFTPNNGQVVNTATPTLMWDAASDPDYNPPTSLRDAPNTLSYVVQLRLMDDTATWNPTDTAYDYQYPVGAGQTQVSVTTALAETKNLTPAKSWFWRVKTIDQGGLSSAWSVVQYFKIDLQTQPPVLEAPNGDPTQCVVPQSGKLMDSYQFFVMFRDPQGNAPTTGVPIQLRVFPADGHVVAPVTMQLTNPAGPNNYRTGVSYSITLPGSTLGYGVSSFEFTYNGIVGPTNAAAPITLPLVGPLVSSNTPSTIAFTNALGNVPPSGSMVYEEGQPVYIQVNDADHNLNTALAETITVTVTSPTDSMNATLTETGPNTGVFFGSLPTRGGTQKVAGFLRVNAGTGVTLTAQYTDPYGAVIGNPTLEVDQATAQMVDTIPPPAVPAGDLTAASDGDGRNLLLNWSKYLAEPGFPPDVANYAVYVATTPFTDVTGKTPVLTVPATVPQSFPVTVPGEVPGTTYYVAVVPMDEVPAHTVMSVNAVSVLAVDSNAPVISAQTPVPVTSTEVPQDQVISFTLSDPGAGIDQTTVSVTVTANLVPPALAGTLTKVSGNDASSNYTWTLAPGVKLPWNSRIYVQVKAKDKVGNALDTGITWYFDAVKDNTRPQLTNTDPATGATNVTVTKKITFHLTDDKSGIDLTSLGVTLQTASLGKATTTTTITADPALTYTGGPLDYTFTYAPASGLLFNTTYVITVSVKDFAGNAIDPAQSSFQFSTPTDNSGPQADSFNPAKDASNVDVGATISLRLTDPLSGVDPTAITMKVNGVDVTSQLKLTPNAPSAIITVSYKPATPLPFATRIPVVVTAADRAPVPNTLVVNDWFFTTVGAPTYSVSGTITGAGGTPAIPGVKVDVKNPADGSVVGTTFTQGTGVYQVSGLLAGTYTVEPSKAEFTFASTDLPNGATRTVTLGPNDAAKQDFIGTQKTYTVSGTVTEQGVGPVAGVTINDGAGHIATTDANGQYLLDTEVNGSYVLVPVKANYKFRPATRSVTVSSGAVTGQDFDAVIDTFTVSGTILDYLGNRVQGVTVASDKGQSAITDEAGRYTVSGIRAGQAITLTPSKPGYSFTLVPPTTFPVTVNSSLSSIDFKAYVTFTNTFGAGVQMVSVPCTPADDRVTSVFGTDLVARWNPFNLLPSYDTPATTPTSNLLHVRPGSGFFVRFASATTQNIAGVPVSTSLPVSVSLGTDWNMVGNPFISPLPFANLAAGSGVVRPYAFGYDASTGSYVLISNVASLGAIRSNLKTWEGVWVRAVGGAATLQMTAPTGVTTSADTPAPKYTMPEGGFVIPVVAQASGREDRCAACGVIPGATSALNIDNPPIMSNTVTVYFVDADGKALKRLIAPSAAGKTTWDMVVRTDISKTQVEMSLPDLSTVPNSLSVTLVDVDGGKRIYARTMSKYEFQIGDGGGLRHFKIEIAPRTAGGLVINTAQASRAGAGMMFTFGVSQDCTVSAEVLNISGRRIRTVVTDKAVTAGVNTLSWDLRGDTGTAIPGGQYLLKLQAVSADGQRVNALVNMNVAR